MPLTKGKANKSGGIRHGAVGTKEEGGKVESKGDGGRVHYVKNEGSSDHQAGGVQTSRSGVDKVKGKT